MATRADAAASPSGVAASAGGCQRGDGSLRAVFVQHRLIVGMPPLPGIDPIARQDIVAAIVDRLLAVPGGLEPLMLLQRDGALLQRATIVAVLTVVLARRVGWPDEQLADLGAAALLHDLGAVLDPERPATASFAWLLDRPADDFWLRCALVARCWREDHGTLATAGRSFGLPAIVRMAVECADLVARSHHGPLAATLAASSMAGAFPLELIGALPDPQP